MYVAGEARESTIVSQDLALQEEFFLGLRLNHGVNMAELAERYSTLLIALFKDGISELIGDKLLEQNGDVIALTRTGRLLSNEVCQRFISVPSEL